MATMRTWHVGAAALVLWLSVGCDELVKAENERNRVEKENWNLCIARDGWPTIIVEAGTRQVACTFRPTCPGAASVEK